MPSRQEQRNSSTAMYVKSVSKSAGMFSWKNKLQISPKLKSSCHTMTVFFTLKSMKTKGLGTANSQGTAKNMEMLHSPLVERGWREVELLDKKGTTLGFLLCPQTFLSVL